MPGVRIADRPRHRGGSRRHPTADLRCHRHGRRLLDDLLMPTLDRALAFDERDHGPVRVAEQLDLDVARLQDPTFQVDGAVAERGSRFRPSGADRVQQVCGFVDRAHPLAAAAGDRFDDEREPDCGRGPGDLFVGGIGAEGLFGSRNDRHAGLDRRRARRCLAPHQPDRFSGRADEGQAGVGAGLGEARRSPRGIRSPDGRRPPRKCAPRR